MSVIAGIPLLAAGFDFGLLIMLAIGFISWLVNMANQKQKQPPPAQAPRPPRPRDDKLRSEIDVFLQEVSGRKPKEEPVAIEIVSEEEIRRRRVVKKPIPRETPTARPPASLAKPRTQPSVFKELSVKPPQVPQPRRRPGAELAERHAIDPSGLSTNLEAHLKTYMAPDRIEQGVQQHIPHEIERRVERNLGSFGDKQQSAQAAPEQARPAQPVSAADVVKFLRDPGGMRRSILVNEVLSRPVGLRKKN
jgi:hypothetical protein